MACGCADFPDETLEQRSFRQQLRSPTDVKIIAADYTWNVHSSRFTTKSPYFEEHCNASTFEATNFILLDDKPLCIARMIQWVYHHIYDLRPSTLVTEDRLHLWNIVRGGNDRKLIKDDVPNTLNGIVNLHKDMYLLAKKYKMTGLKNYAGGQLLIEASASRHLVWTVWDFAKEADASCNDIMNSIMAFFEANYTRFLDDKRFEQAVKDDPNLAWKVAQWAGTIDDGKLEQLIKQNPELALSIAKNDFERAAKRQKR